MGIAGAAAVVYAAASAITFGAFALDKRAAAGGRPRTRERTLHLLGLCGGWPGSLLAMALLRHKSRKGTFLLVTAAIALLHAAAWARAWGWW